MIGAAVLITGLLLILAGLAAARIPGGATFTPSGIGHSPARAFLLSPIHPATWYANAGLTLGLFTGIAGFATLAAFVSFGFSTLVFGIGIVFIAIGIEASRVFARIERRRAFAGEPTRAPAHPYRPLRGRIQDIVRAEFLDESRWRDVLYVVINLPLSLIEFLFIALVWSLAVITVTMPIWYDAMAAAPLVGVLEPLGRHDAVVVVQRTIAGAAMLATAGSLSQLVMSLHRAVVASLLCTSESRELRRQLELVRKSRSDVLDVEATELHRIERDLHDGAQQRLVALTIDLGLASERIDQDPAAAKQLILEGQQQAREALSEIRDLVRGIAPSILLDRGLGAALDSVAGRGPVPAVIQSELTPGERLPVGAERAGYFVVTEALANVAKHSGARHCEIRLRRGDRQLIVEVWDDGMGGATAEPGGGLAGLQSRVAGVDGTFAVSSPPGGPTLVRAVIPIAGAASPTS